MLKAVYTSYVQSIDPKIYAICDMLSKKTKAIDELLSQLTIEEKVSLLSGHGSWGTVPIYRLGIGPVKLTDGPAGARGSSWSDGSKSVLLPCGTSLGATFNEELIQDIGRLLGREVKRKKAHVLLAPTMNIHRSPLGGRNFESFGEDPFLIVRISLAMVAGVQEQGVGAAIKHFVSNEQETRRFNVNAIIDEATLREVYLRPFETVIRECDPFTIMTAYNKVNSIHNDMSQVLLNKILRQEWMYQGAVTSDWGGTNSAVQGIVAGLDLEMPGPPKRRGQALLDAIKTKKLDISAIDQCVERILRLAERCGVLNQYSPPSPSHLVEESVDSPEERMLVRRACHEGIVLLKNDGLLPLSTSSLKRVAIVGPNALHTVSGGSGSAALNPHYVTNLVDSFKAAIGSNVAVQYAPGVQTHRMLPLLGSLVNVPDTDTVGLQVEFFSGYQCSGDVICSTKQAGSQIFVSSKRHVSASFERRLLDRNRRYVYENLQIDQAACQPPVRPMDNTLFGSISGIRVGCIKIIDEDALLEEAVSLAEASDVAIIVVGLNNYWEKEGVDRDTMHLPGRSEELIQRVCQIKPSAIVHAWYQGQENGNALADILLGKAQPSGKLPVTFPKRLEDHGSFENFPGDVDADVCEYKEGLLVGYRWFDEQEREPLFEFGHGLSYTTFSLSDFEITGYISETSSAIISVKVHNIGTMAGSEVVQVYMSSAVSLKAYQHIPLVSGRYLAETSNMKHQAAHVRSLQGFKKVHLEPGEAKCCRMTLDKRSVERYDVGSKSWVTQVGLYTAEVGTSSRKILGRVSVPVLC